MHPIIVDLLVSVGSGIAVTALLLAVRFRSETLAMYLMVAVGALTTFQVEKDPAIALILGASGGILGGLLALKAQRLVNRLLHHPKTVK